MLSALRAEEWSEHVKAGSRLIVHIQYWTHDNRITLRQTRIAKAM